MKVGELIGKTACGTKVKVYNDWYSDEYDKPDYKNHFPEWVLNGEVEVIIPRLTFIEIRFIECEE